MVDKRPRGVTFAEPSLSCSPPQPPVDTHQGKTDLIGIASSTAGGETRCTGVSVYTNVQAYEEWIHAEIETVMAALFIDTAEADLL